ncbi:DotI/IcmL/TraM family protein [Pseudoalteromonas nigrifaciens]|uniref:DotI/IcmL/TraM family protein n=1 Tax=Pseudoalteromonas nigrifaciens TaxID=28109 RepID=UPI001787CB8B|nr:DotI/IcmL/TraM family protein [Pseudoalteromonas nigrifaciens]MBE0420531.1 DotI/IcmL/TraM family protein [Pseudoalteromonas nigrifaciens]
MRSDWLDKGIYVFSKDDIVSLYNESLALKRQIYIKLTLLVPVLIFLVALIGFFSNYLMTPKIGDIGAIAPDGETVELTPSINPSIRKEFAYEFAVNAAIDIRTFFFLTYYKDITNLEHLFTPRAYNEYLLALEESGIFKRVKAESLNVTAALSPKSNVNAAFNIIDGERLFFVRIDINIRIENLSGDDDFAAESLFFTLAEVDRGKSKYGLRIKSLEPF